jgi:hypothetical protein
MVPEKIVRSLAVIVICSLLLSAGCAPFAEETVEPKIVGGEEKPKVVVEKAKPEVEPEKEKPPVVVEKVKPEVEPEKEKPAVELALKFTPQDSTTYKFTTEAKRSIKWEGPVSNEPAFRGGNTSSTIEITFTQQIQSTDEKGNAVAKITIDSLKYLSIIRDNPAIDFDSAREKDQNNPLAKLIGQSYTIEITPAGRVSRIIDVNQAQAAVQDNSSAGKTALALLSTDVIKDRHTISAIPDPDKNRLRTGENWSRIKTFSFGLMGSKSYERIYTLTDVTDTDKIRLAFVEMKAVPTPEMAEQMHKEKTIGDFSKMFENTETYNGQLKLNLTAGKVENCLEKLQSEWVAVEPAIGQKEEQEPAVLIMTASRLYLLEKTG